MKPVKPTASRIGYQRQSAKIAIQPAKILGAKWGHENRFLDVPQPSALPTFVAAVMPAGLELRIVVARDSWILDAGAHPYLQTHVLGYFGPNG